MTPEDEARAGATKRPSPAVVADMDRHLYFYRDGGLSTGPSIDPETGSPVYKLLPMERGRGGLVPDALTTTDALANACRLLQAAEQETNLALMEQEIRAAEAWVAVAGLLHDTE